MTAKLNDIVRSPFVPGLFRVVGTQVSDSQTFPITWHVLECSEDGTPTSTNIIKLTRVIKVIDSH